MSSPHEGAERVMVGRARELAELERGLADALRGNGRLFLLAGEPGIGKTRLSDELSQRARSLGVPVHWGRCWEAGGAPAYWPWIEVLSGIARAQSDEALSRALGDNAGLVAELVPEVRARLPETRHAIAQSPSQLRFGLFRAVAALLHSAAEPQALVIVLDDLHAADEESLLLLHFVARELRTRRALIIATYRDVDARYSETVSDAIARLSREGVTLPLTRLGAQDAQQLLLAQAGALVSQVSADILRRTQGNPLFLEEMARLLVLQGASGIAGAELPSGVRSLLQLRLSRVPLATRELLELGAMIGDEMETSLLAEAAQAPVAEVEQALSGARHAGVLVALEPGRFRFSHALVREVLERELTEARHRQLHTQIARALEARAARTAAPAYAELAHHWLESGDNLPRAVQCAQHAAERSLSLFAFEAATSLLERALRATQAAADQPALHASLLIALGQTQIRRGHSTQGRAACLQAAALARSLGHAELLARAALALGEELTSALIDATLVGLLQEALAALPERDDALRVQVSARLAAALQPHHDLMYPISLARDAIASARRIGDPETLLGALYTGMSAMMDIVDPRERIPLNLEAEALAEKLSDRERLLRTQIRLMFDHMELGDFAAADARIAACERLARASDARRYLWRVPLMHSMRALIHGRFSDAEALSEEARTLGQAAADPQLERTWVLHHEGLLRAWERHDDMLAFDPEARRMRAQLYSGPHWQNGGSAFTYGRVERLDDARMYLDLVPQDDWPLVRNPPAFAHVGEPMALVGSEALCRRVYELLMPGRELLISWGFTKFIWEGSASRVLGLLAARLGDDSAMHAHFQHAIEQLETLAALPYLARTRYEYGRALSERDSAGDRERARTLIAQAGESAQQLGMSGLLRIAEQRLQGLGPTPSARQHAPSTPELPLSLVLEGELMRVSFAAETFLLRDSLGLRYLAKLVSEPGRSIHAVELSSGVAADGGSDPEDRGDAGELLDQKARDDYRRRARALQEQIEEADSRGASDHAEHARQELAFLTAELSRAVGLGGRVRRAGAASERARSAVQRRIRSAIERITEQAPAVGTLLERTVKTGTYCVFLPADATTRSS